MKHEVDCGVIQDLLPLYEDGVASEEAQEMVRRHLKDCPDCREELRRMRTPVSMPPETDGEQWQKFVEKREKVRRGKKIKLAWAAAALAVIAAFCLWYTRPTRFSELCPGADDSGGLAMTYPVWNVHPDGKVDTGFGGGTLPPGDPAIGELLEILELYTYHRSLLSLIPWELDSSGKFSDADWTILTGGENSVVMSTFNGRLELYYKGGHLYFTVDGNEAFVKLIRRWVEKNSPEEETVSSLTP